MEAKRLSYKEADLFQYYVMSLTGVTSVKVYERTGDAAIVFSGSRENLIEEIQRFSYNRSGLSELVPKNSGRQLNQEYKEKCTTEELLYLLVHVNRLYIKEDCHRKGITPEK